MMCLQFAIGCLQSVAYKNAVGARRASWRIISSVEQKESNKAHVQNKNLSSEYRLKVEAELQKICQDILDLLDNILIKHTSVSTLNFPLLLLERDWIVTPLIAGTVNQRFNPTTSRP
eukprot:GHVT01047727.1.p3 GENE.GHVT01047727.1~~GHVT01047727.1.p3  ORF type:complete len:117 (-),score=10.63 GHVT01047727.1:2087-2437(-)